MTMLVESKSQARERRSERTIPLVSGEETVLISIGRHSMIAKLLDFSEDGILVYLGEEFDVLTVGAPCTLTLYDEGKVFEAESKVARNSHRLIAFEFTNPASPVKSRLRAKITNTSDWMRIKGKKGS